jgi:glucose/arabinose dehydrogenase
MTLMRVAIVAFTVLGIATAGIAWQAAHTPRDVQRVYADMCASCHGSDLKGGGTAPSLVDETWKFGGDDASIATSIRDGRPAAGMPPMGAALGEQTIRSLVIYIREQGAVASRGATTYARPAANVTVRSEKIAFRLETVVDGVSSPWVLAFLPDGRLLITEKNGTLRVASNGRLEPQPVSGIPPVWSGGQGGLLDVALHPDYARNGWIYLSYSDPGESGSAMTAVVRGKLRGGAFVDQQTIFKAPPELYRRANVHFGSRFVFDEAGHLFFSIGERGQKDDAQDVTRPNGKVHRVYDDGRIPEDNPFVNRQGAIPSIWSFGNRNPQGLARDPDTGILWEVEHGPRGGDELNRIEKGRNYGWPVITYGMNYDGTPMTDRTAAEGMEQPVTYWVPSIAVSSVEIYRSDVFEPWKGNLLVGALAQQELRRLVLENGRVTHQEVLFKNGGRVRDVVVGPDGYVYVVFNAPDRIARLVPVSGTH